MGLRHSHISYLSVGSGMRCMRSSSSNTESREPSFAVNGRAFSHAAFSAQNSLNSPMV